MRRIIFVITMLSCFMVQADEIKRDSIIQALIAKELGPDLTWRTDESILRDSLNEYPINSVCLHKAVRLTNGMPNFVANITSMIYLFPKGTTSFEPKKLSTDKYDKFLHNACEMKKWLIQYKDLINFVDNYIPYEYKKVTGHYTAFNSNGDTSKYHGVYFFDEQDNLDKYFWFDEQKWTMTMGLIVLAINHDYSFFEKSLDLFGFQYKESLMLYLMGNEDVEFSINEINQILALREIQARKESQSTSNISHQDATSTQNSNNHNTTNQNTLNQYKSRVVKMKGPQYLVIRNVCGATYTMKAMKQFTEYATNNNTTGISYMIVTGQLTALRKGQMVTMLELGNFTSKIQLSNGAIVYTDTECLKKQQVYDSLKAYSRLKK